LKIKGGEDRKRKPNLFDSIGERVGGALIEAFNPRPVNEV